MICLTGDLHHQSLGTENQRHSDVPEIKLARRYLSLLKEADVKVTFFVSGRAFVEEWEDLEPIVSHPHVEIGGHNWSCLTPALWHRLCNKLLHSYNGPRWYQRWDAMRTIRVIRERTGKTIRAWRNHMYMHGPFTEEVLWESGIQVCSDGVRRNSPGPVAHREGIYNFPINVIPDHEHLYHGERTPEWVERWVRRYAWSDDFGSRSYHIDEWVEIVLEGLRGNEERGVISNMIIHPITMYLCDEFRGFRRILEYLADRETAFVSQASQMVRGSRGERNR